MVREKEMGVINLVMAANTTDHGKMADTVDMEFVLGKTDGVIEVNGVTVWLMGRVLKHTLIEPFDTMDNGWMTNQFVKAEQSTKMIRNYARVGPGTLLNLLCLR